MADITVRRLTFEFPEDLPALPDPNDVRGSCELAVYRALCDAKGLSHDKVIVIGEPR